MKVFSVADNITSPLGADTVENITALRDNVSAISLNNDPLLSPKPVHVSKIPQQLYNNIETNAEFTYLENLIIHSIQSTLHQLSKPLDLTKTVFILSTTKGNIDLLASQSGAKINPQRVNLPVLASVINDHFQLPHTSLVVSNACISGVSALLTAKKLILTHQYDHAIVCGADLISEFVISGFQSFMAISDKPCKPYDVSRNGITLGEAVGTVVLSRDETVAGKHATIVKGGGQSNDANHISGPSRTGEGLKIAVEKALDESKLNIADIDYINTHGTATEYNDEMEGQAFNRLRAQEIPVNSLKGYYGHTLGASGMIESIVAMWQLNNNFMLRSQGFDQLGLTLPLHVINENTEKELNCALKTSSGFGGCNAAIIFEKT